MRANPGLNRSVRSRRFRIGTLTLQLTVSGKGGKTRAVLLPATMWKDLRTLSGSADLDGPVFRSRTGKSLDRSRILRIVQEAAKRAGVEGAV